MVNNSSNNSRKVAIIGTGFVGATTAFAMMQYDFASQIALIDIDKNKAQGQALDLLHGIQFTEAFNIVAGDSFELVKDAKVVVICAGIPQKIDQPREELLNTNIKIFKDIIPKITKYNKDCILLVVTNPLDILTYVAYKLSGFPACRVFGTGTVLDTARLRYLLADYFSISAKDISAYILGEHGDSQFVWWSHANIAGVPINKMPNFSKDILEDIHLKVKNAVYEVIKKKGVSYYAISLVVSKIVRAILEDQSRVFTLSTCLENLYGYKDIFLSVPTVVKSNGICQKLPLFLNEKEEVLFKESADKILNIIKKLEI